MKFAIITHVPHGGDGITYFAYSPYVREMNIWVKFATEVIVVAPLVLKQKTNIELDYRHANIAFNQVGALNFTNAYAAVKSIFLLPSIFIKVYSAMRQADHIHLRCPGNMGLIGCLVQVLFPKKPKSAKYAGNWDPKANQPVSYKFQKWILSNTFLSRNMQVLVYGTWDGNTKNIKPFFTASYREADKTDVPIRTLNGKIQFIFIGTLVAGKQPLYAVKLVQQLFLSGYDVALDLYGEGAERAELESYIATHHLREIISVKGNQMAHTVRKAYQDSHFLILPSKSEGWPKVVAEAMFWGCVPIASKVSCVPDMLGHGNRGHFLEMEINADFMMISAALSNGDDYAKKAYECMTWSRHYTLDLFENEIESILA